MCCRQNIFAKKFVKHISDRGNVSKIHKKPLNKKIKIFNQKTGIISKEIPQSQHSDADR